MEFINSFVLSPEFNNFELINLNQAWSLFFTAGRDDSLLVDDMGLSIISFLSGSVVGYILFFILEI
jgi:hypothetical protein